MAGDVWRPVTTIGDHGLVLAVGPDGSGQVVDGGQVRGPAAGRGLTMLLPLLERTCEQVGTEVADQVTDGFPAPLWDELLEFALQWPTEYWPGRALAWVEAGIRLTGCGMSSPRSQVISAGHNRCDIVRCDCARATTVEVARDE